MDANWELHALPACTSVPPVAKQRSRAASPVADTDRPTRERSKACRSPVKIWISAADDSPDRDWASRGALRVMKDL